MAKITNTDIARINELYYKYKTYAEVARQTGFAPSTVKKYVIKDWKPIEQKNIQRFSMELVPEFDTSSFKGVDNYGDLCTLSDEEKEEMKKLWEEMAL